MVTMVIMSWQERNSYVTEIKVCNKKLYGNLNILVHNSFSKITWPKRTICMYTPSSGQNDTCTATLYVHSCMSNLAVVVFSIDPISFVKASAMLWPALLVSILAVVSSYNSGSMPKTQKKKF